MENPGDQADASEEPALPRFMRIGSPDDLPLFVGNSGVFRDLLDLTLPRVRNDPDAATEVVVNALLRLSREVKGGGRVLDPYRWVWSAILSYEIPDYFRRRAKQPPPLAERGVEPEPWEALLAKEEVDALRAAVSEALAPEQAERLWRYFSRESSVKELARLYRSHPNTFRSQIQALVKKLRERLTGEHASRYEPPQKRPKQSRGPRRPDAAKRPPGEQPALPGDEEAS